MDGDDDFPPEVEDDASEPWGDEALPPIPDAVDEVVEAFSLESVFAAERLRRVHALRLEMLAEASGRGAGVTDIVERSIRLELAAALSITEHAAGRMIALADALMCRYPRAMESLRHADMTLRHAEILVEYIDQLDPALREQVVGRAVELAEAEPVGVFRRALRRLVDTVQAPTVEERYRHAVQSRRVVLEPGEDGMGVLTAFAPHVELAAIFHRATAIAKPIASREGETRTLDQVRTDVFCDLLIGGTTDAVPPEARGIRASVVVTVPALALLDDAAAETADLPVVEGVGPIPLSRARELCGGDASWMRVLTHPETGMVLSVGRERYRAPESLRKLTRWRADRCMGPGCGVPASRCEIDHQVAWEEGGETSLENHAPLCKGHHLVKHHGGWDVRQIPGSGGVIEWNSPTGRRYVVQPERRVPVFRAAATTDAMGAAPF